MKLALYEASVLVPSFEGPPNGSSQGFVLSVRVRENELVASICTPT